MRPKISVIMGVYYLKSDISYLDRSITSILNQSYKNIELIICDDGSSMAAVNYVNQVSARDMRVKIIRKGYLYSLPEKLNACLLAAEGEYVARMDDDDRSHLERLQKQLNYLEENQDISFVGCAADLYRNGVCIGEKRFPAFPTVKDFYFSQPYLHPTLMFKRDILEQVNGYSEKMSCRLCEDYDLLLRLYHAGYKGANMNEILFDYTLPLTAKGNRKMKHRVNEVITRYERFKELKQLPKALPWVIKPIIVGLIPEKMLYRIKEKKR